MYSRNVWERGHDGIGIRQVPPGYRGEVLTDAYEKETSAPPQTEETAEHPEQRPTPVPEKHRDENVQKHGAVGRLMSSFGFPDGVSADDLLLCAVILCLASEREGDVGDILLLSALLLCIK